MKVSARDHVAELNPIFSVCGESARVTIAMPGVRSRSETPTDSCGSDRVIVMAQSRSVRGGK